MTAEIIKEWWPLILIVLGWIITGAVGWTKITTKVNGLGGRVTATENAAATEKGRLDRMERELSEYRRDARDAANGLSRVEQGMKDVADKIAEGNLSIGSQLHNLKDMINDKDAKVQNRLVRIETVQQIEAKVGPIPTE